jgi:hypothetical protein
VSSQVDVEPDEPDIAGRGFFDVGYIGLDMDDLNASLEAADLPALDGSFFTLGGGGYGARGRFLIGGEGHGLIGSDETTPDGEMKVSMHGGYGLFRLGYLVTSYEGLDLFPTLGIGGGGTSLKIVERSAPTFDDIIENPRRGATLNTGSLLLDVGAVAHLRLGGGKDRGDGERGGLLIGLQAGYTFAPADAGWDFEGVDVAGGPTLELQGAYVRFSVGGWGKRNR